VLVPTDINYQLQPEAIRQAITPRTRAVVTVSPNNPTGAVYPEPVLRAVNELCREGGVFQLTMHPHVIGYRSRIWIVEEVIRHARSLGDVWFATHAQVVQWAKAHAN